MDGDLFKAFETLRDINLQVRCVQSGQLDVKMVDEVREVPVLVDGKKTIRSYLHIDYLE